MGGHDSNNLRELRIRRLMIQKELSEKSGVSQVTISFIENSLTAPMDLTKGKLARALKCPVSAIFPGGDAPINHLLEARVQKGWSQKELARRSGVTQVTISFVENGLTAPTDLTKQKLARALKCSVLQLFPEETRKKKVREIV